MYHLCEKYYKPITVQYYITDFASCLSGLTSLDLRTNWIYELIGFIGRELICIQETYAYNKKTVGIARF